MYDRANLEECKKRKKEEMIKIGKLERRYLEKEDVNIVAAALNPPSSDSASPTVPSFGPSDMERIWRMRAPWMLNQDTQKETQRF